MKKTVPKDWKEIGNDISFGGMIKGSSAAGELDKGVSFKIKKWQMTDWWGTGDDWEYGQAVYGEDTTFLKIEPVEDDQLFKTTHVDNYGVSFDSGDTYLRDASVHRHVVILKNANNLNNFYTSYWRHTAFDFSNPYSTNTLALKTEFEMQYSTPYVISFWYKTPLVAPTGNHDFRIMSLEVDSADAFKTGFDPPYSPPSGMPSDTDKGPSLVFNLGYTSGAYNGNFIYKKPDDTDIIQTTPLVINEWYHFTVEYYRMMGSKNIQIRFFKNGVVIGSP